MLTLIFITLICILLYLNGPKKQNKTQEVLEESFWLVSQVCAYLKFLTF